MRELHDRLNVNGLACVEEWPYMPHLTIVKMSDEAQAQHAYRMARTRWADFDDGRCIDIHHHAQPQLVAVACHRGTVVVEHAGLRVVELDAADDHRREATDLR